MANDQYNFLPRLTQEDVDCANVKIQESIRLVLSISNLIRACWSKSRYFERIYYKRVEKLEATIYSHLELVRQACFGSNHGDIKRPYQLPES